MPYAVELFFNNELEMKILGLWQKLAAVGITSTLLDIDARPHLCLAVLNDADAAKLCQLVEDFAESVSSFAIDFDSIGSFDTDERVVFLRPVKNDGLREVHSNFHQRLKAENLHSHSYYVPENWQPHCTIAMNVEEPRFKKAIEHCRRAEHRFYGEIIGIGVIEFRPIKELAKFKLKIRGIAK